MSMIKIKPEKGLLVRDPLTREPLKIAGENKPRNTYWIRRLNDKSVHLVKPKKDTA